MLFQVTQYIKDCTGAFLFFLFANMPLLLNDLEMLCLFFSFVCLVDSIFISIRRYYNYPVTMATVKDTVAVVCCGCFTIILACKVDIVNWQKIFYAAFIIDYMSICSVCCIFNIYRVTARQFLTIMRCLDF